MKLPVLVTAFAGLVAAPSLAQNPTVATTPVNRDGNNMPLYRVTVVQRSTKVVNYQHRSGETKVDLRGTPLAPYAFGKAQVESKSGRTTIEAEVEKLPPAGDIGNQFLTYVLWAISPEGRPMNLGEILPNGDGKMKLTVTSDLQAFALIVTAEPYYAVFKPSDAVVLENVVRPDTTGRISYLDAKYELLPRGQYQVNYPAGTHTVVLDKKTPLALYEARNAVEIARWAGAEQYAADSFRKAEQNLKNAESYQSGGHDKKSVISLAREAVQTAADARAIAIQRKQAEQRAAEQLRQERQVQQAKNQAAQAQEQAEQAEQQRQQAQRDRQAAEQARMDADRARQQAEAARASALAEQQSAQQEADRARQAAATAVAQQQQLRVQLQQQLNTVLETRATARGLIMNMSDVLFDIDRYTLKPGARERLAKVAGILLTHPDLRLEVEGHTDSTGTHEHNQTLSEQRAAAVRDYLVSQGIPMDDIVAHGFAELQPVASNDTREGRQQNRRVEIIVSGQSIGTQSDTFSGSGAH